MPPDHMRTGAPGSRDLDPGSWSGFPSSYWNLQVSLGGGGAAVVVCGGSDWSNSQEIKMIGHIFRREEGNSLLMPCFLF